MDRQTLIDNALSLSDSIRDLQTVQLESLEALHETRLNIDLETSGILAKVSEERTEDGKPKFTNEASRKAEVNVRASQSEDLQDKIKVAEELEAKYKRGQIVLEHSLRVFKVYDSALRSLAN